MMQIVESGDDYYEPRFSSGSVGCLFPSLSFIDSPRKSFYNKLQQQPLRLAVLKLDGSSFEIEVAKMGTVAELKRAVEAAFDHLPKMGPGRVSWEHLWGQFCLCHEGQKLLSDNDYISMLGIRDGDQATIHKELTLSDLLMEVKGINMTQLSIGVIRLVGESRICIPRLQFVHHASTTCNFVNVRSNRVDPGVPSMDRHKNREIDGVNHEEITGEKEDEDNTMRRREQRLSGLFRGWFPLSGFPKRSCSSRISRSNMLGSFKNCMRFSSNKYDMTRRLSW